MSVKRNANGNVMYCRRIRRHLSLCVSGNHPPAWLGDEQTSDSDFEERFRTREGTRHACDGDAYGSPEFNASRRPGVKTLFHRQKEWGEHLFWRFSDRVMLIMGMGTGGARGRATKNKAKRRPKRDNGEQTKRT